MYIDKRLYSNLAADVLTEFKGKTFSQEGQAYRWLAQRLEVFASDIQRETLQKVKQKTGITNEELI